MVGLSRRSLIFGGLGGGLALSLRYLTRSSDEENTTGAATGSTRGTSSHSTKSGQYNEWQDVYRDKWQWDRIVRGTHTSANCNSSCAWNLYVREGIVWREEQSAAYDITNSEVPDFNPRGCQKGASCSDLMTGVTRLRYPLRRVGPRGGGRWKRISWDEALSEVAAELVGTLHRRGGEGALCELGGNFDFGTNVASTVRFFRQLGIPVTDPTAHTGDLPLGGVMTLGAGFTGGSSDDWFRSDYLVIWAHNPVVSRIPDAHYLTEMRYRGGRVVTITPEYCASAVHADYWLSPRPGTDAALALSACQVIVSEGLYDGDYIREQTDLPFLVRDDNKLFLRESDLIPDGKDDLFALWDEVSDALVWAPGTPGSTQQTIVLPEGVRPALNIEHSPIDVAGETITVSSVFSLLRKRLYSYTPDRVASITGLTSSVIQQFAREFANAPAALILSSFGGCKNYHSDLMQRSQILLASLTGNLGRAGGGWRSGGYIELEGVGLVSMLDNLGLLGLVGAGVRSFVDKKALETEFLSTYISSSMYHTIHGGLLDIRTAPEHGDPNLPRPVSEYLNEALDNAHFPIGPPPGSAPPDVIVSILGNILRHTRMAEQVRETLFDKARLIVSIELRMSETARYSDIILPAAGWYEKVGLKYVAGYVPYVTLADQAVAPLADTKPEWEIYSLLARQIEAQARDRNIKTTTSFLGADCRIDNLAERFSDGGRFGPLDNEKVISYILENSSATQGITLERLRREGGAIRVTGLGPKVPTNGMYTDYDIDQPIVPLRDFTEHKQPYPTLTGRQQFYIDHPWFIELDEQLPGYKGPPLSGGDHPFTLTTAHTRWSIHAMWRDHPMMLRLQRGEPIIYLNSAVASERDIGEHELVQVWNDVGDFSARVALTDTMRSDQIHIFHAWEPFQFHGGKSHQSLLPSPIKPTHLASGYGQIHWGFSYYEPVAVDRDTRVDIRKMRQKDA
jgi:DMSO reductase family type II enzyme molybdopterin subunit